MKPPKDLFSIIKACLEESTQRMRGTQRPCVTLSYAQSIDESIACRPGRPLALSCKDAMVFTQRLRSIHDGIPVGIGTVLADNPC